MDAESPSNGAGSRIPLPRKGILKPPFSGMSSPVWELIEENSGDGVMSDGEVAAPINGRSTSAPTPTRHPLRDSFRSRRRVEYNGASDWASRLESPTDREGRFASSSPGRGRGGSKRPSQIPKLSVSWWETNSVAGEAPRDIPSDTDEETSSVRSFCSNTSSLISANWHGKSTKYVPHCQKRHLSDSEPGEYLTPTQRKNRMIAELRKQLRNTMKQVEEKEKHIDQLRDRLSELESVLDQGGFLSENNRLVAKLKLVQEQHRREKEAMAQKYESRLRKLRKCLPTETDCTGPDWGREAALIASVKAVAADYDSGITSDEAQTEKAHADAGFEKSAPDAHDGVKFVDVAVMTDNQEYVEQLEAEKSQLSNSLQICQLDRMSLQNRIIELEATAIRVNELESEMTYYSKTVKATNENCDNPSCKGRESELVAQVEAYKHECVAWRTKASEAELATKAANERFDTHMALLEATQQKLVETQTRLQDYEDIGFGGDCQNPSCVEARGQLYELEEQMNQLQQISSTISRQGSASISTTGGTPKPKSNEIPIRSPSPCGSGIGYRSEIFQSLAATLQAEKEQVQMERDDLEGKIRETQRRLEVKTEELETCTRELHSLRDSMKVKNTELEVAELTMERMREQTIQQTSRISMLQDRIHAFERSGIAVPQGDSGVSATQSIMKKKARFGMIETVSRNFQTDLTYTQIDEWFSELTDLRTKYKELSEKYEAEGNDLKFRLDQTAQSLTVKSSVAESLSAQLQQVQQDYEDARQRWNSERDFLTSKIQQVSPVAARVPFLEKELTDAIDDSAKERIATRAMKDEYEQALEEALSGNLKAHVTTEEYWKDKISVTQKELDTTKRKLERTQQDFNSCKILLNLEKAELERKIEEQCTELDRLHGKIFGNRQEANIQTEWKKMDKSASCYPVALDVATEIFEGDLYDEKLENIKMLKGELDVTRRQTEILSEKLTESNRQTLAECQKKTSELLDLLSQYQAEMEDLRVQRITEINEKAQLEGKLETLTKERDTLRKKEKENLAKLEHEFQLIQTDLQNVVQRYEDEKKELDSQLLEMKDDNDRLYHKLRTVKRNLYVAADGQKATIVPRATTDDIEERSSTDEDSSSPDEVICVVSTTSKDQDENNVERTFEVTAHPCDESTAAIVPDFADSPLIEDIPSSEKSPGMIDSGISIKSIESPSKSPLRSVHIREVANIKSVKTEKAKTVAVRLMKENEELRDEMFVLKSKIEGIIASVRHSDIPPVAAAMEILLLKHEDVTLAVQSAETTQLQSGVPQQDSVQPQLEEEPAGVDESSHVATTVESNQWAIEQLEELNDEIRIVLEDHPVVSVVAEPAKLVATKETEMSRKLTKWLSSDLEQEKLELEMICQWYEKDKVKLKNMLSGLRFEYVELKRSKDFVAEQLKEACEELAMIKHMHMEVCRELELYKREDVEKVKRMITLENETLMPVSQSENNLAMPIAEDTPENAALKCKTGQMLKEVVCLEKKFRAAKYEKTEAEEKLSMLRGELEVVRAQYETERDKLLAKIHELGGESWSEESGINFVRELQKNLEIKKQELFDLSCRYEKDVRQLQEELYVERHKKGNAEFIKKMTKEMESKDRQISRLAAQVEEARGTTGAKTSIGSTSKILLRRQIEEDKEELQVLSKGIAEERLRYETHINDVKAKLKSTVSILAEKENVIRILERELRCTEDSLESQKRKFDEDKRLMLEAIDMLDAEKQEMLKMLAAQQSDPNKVVQIEKLWKKELRATKSRYEAELKSLRHDLMGEHERLERLKRNATQKLRSTSTILTEREGCIRILEKEVRSAEDGLMTLRDRYESRIRDLEQESEELKLRMQSRIKAGLESKRVHFRDEVEVSPSADDWSVESSSLELRHEIAAAAEALNHMRSSLDDIQSQDSSDTLTYVSASTLDDQDIPNIQMESYEDNIDFALSDPFYRPTPPLNAAVASSSVPSQSPTSTTDVSVTEHPIPDSNPSLLNRLSSDEISGEEIDKSSETDLSSFMTATDGSLDTPAPAQSTSISLPASPSKSDELLRLQKELRMTTQELEYTKEMLESELRRNVVDKVTPKNGHSLNVDDACQTDDAELMVSDQIDRPYHLAPPQSSAMTSSVGSDFYFSADAIIQVEAEAYDVSTQMLHHPFLSSVDSACQTEDMRAITTESQTTLFGLESLSSRAEELSYDNLCHSLSQSAVDSTYSVEDSSENVSSHVSVISMDAQTDSSDLTFFTVSGHPLLPGVESFSQTDAAPLCCDTAIQYDDMLPSGEAFIPLSLSSLKELTLSDQVTEVSMHADSERSWVVATSAQTMDPAATDECYSLSEEESSSTEPGLTVLAAHPDTSTRASRAEMVDDSSQSGPHPAGVEQATETEQIHDLGSSSDPDDGTASTIIAYNTDSASQNSEVRAIAVATEPMETRKDEETAQENANLDNLLASLGIEDEETRNRIKSNGLPRADNFSQTELPPGDLSSTANFEKLHKCEDELEQALVTNRVLETKIEELNSEMELREQKHQEMYMIMFRKGQEVATAEIKPEKQRGRNYSGGVTLDVSNLELNSKPSFRDVIKPEYDSSTYGETSSVGSYNVEDFQAQVHREVSKWNRKQSTEEQAKPPGLSTEEILLRFLRDAVYYYLMDRDPKDHLVAIMSLLNFSERQRSDVRRIKRL